jgi:hypothetical protein
METHLFQTCFQFFFLVFGQGRFFNFSILVGFVSMTPFKTICPTKKKFMILKTTFFWIQMVSPIDRTFFWYHKTFISTRIIFQYVVSCFENKRLHLVTNIQKGFLWHLNMLDPSISIIFSQQKLVQTSCWLWLHPMWMNFFPIANKIQNILYSCNVANIHDSWRLCYKSIFNSLNGKFELVMNFYVSCKPLIKNENLPNNIDQSWRSIF